MKWLPLQICSPLQVGAIDRLVKGKKNLIKELCYRGEEKHGEKRGETVKERDLWEEERPELVIMRVWGEEKKKEERKSEKSYHERENVPKNYVSHSYRQKLYL